MSRDFVNALNLFEFDMNYGDITNLPDKKEDWLKERDKSLQIKYENECIHFIKNNGSSLLNIFNCNRNFVLDSKKQHNASLKMYTIIIL